MKIAIIMNENSYVGREYLKKMKEYNIEVDIITIGHFPEIDAEEERRCGGRWTPPLLRQNDYINRIRHFDSLKSRELLAFLKDKNYDLGIQGGTGIIKKEIIDSFHYGILNFHPGDLPCYRGCSAPEWQLWDGKPVVCTCHLIDENIDSGPIYLKKELFPCGGTMNYFEMRSEIYPRIASFLCETISSIDDSFLSICNVQNEGDAIYRQYIGDENIDILIKKMANNHDNEF